jgi:hypothetical protein
MKCPKVIAVLCFAACVSGALAQTKEKTAQYNALGAAGARAVRDALNDPDSFRVTAAWLVPAHDPSDPTIFWVCFVGRKKNDMGGYVKILAEAEGWLNKGSAVFVMLGESDGENAKYIRQSCTSNFVANGNHVFADVTEAAKAALKADLDKTSGWNCIAGPYLHAVQAKQLTETKLLLASQFVPPFFAIAKAGPL